MHEKSYRGHVITLWRFGAKLMNFIRSQRSGAFNLDWCGSFLMTFRTEGGGSLGCFLIPCQFTGCSFGAAAILQYETLKSRARAAKDGEELEKLVLVRIPNDTCSLWRFVGPVLP